PGDPPALRSLDGPRRHRGARALRRPRRRAGGGTGGRRARVGARRGPAGARRPAARVGCPPPAGGGPGPASAGPPAPPPRPGDPPLASGARLLPAGDPFLHQRDRSTLIPDKAIQRAVWRPVGRPGLVLVAGHPVATWRSRMVKGRLAVEVDPFHDLGARRRAAVREEAEVVAAFRGAEDAEVTFIRP